MAPLGTNLGVRGEVEVESFVIVIITSTDVSVGIPFLYFL